MKEYGWRTIPISARMRAIKYYDGMPETTEVEKRDKLILRYFLIDNLCASAIARRNDPAIVCFSNKCKWEPQLTPSSILRIIYKHCPYLKPERNSRSNDKRVELRRKRENIPSTHIKQCAFCGSKKTLEEHHMIPLMFGGDNDERNLIYLCHKCHAQVTQYQIQVKQLIHKKSRHPMDGRESGKGI